MQGCDASVLLSSTDNFQSEQESGANRRLGGFEAIDDIKAELEKECQGIVSCADILALATRDAVSLQVCFQLSFNSFTSYQARAIPRARKKNSFINKYNTLL